MKNVARWLSVAFIMAFAVPAAAQTTPDLALRIERDNRPRPSLTHLDVHFIVTVTDRATGNPPDAVYSVFGIAANLSGGEQSPPFECEHSNDNDPTVPRGVYECPIYVDHGGDWNFTTVVNKRSADPRKAPVTLGRASAPFVLDTQQVNTGNATKKQIKGRFFEVALLQAHALAAAAWFACALALAVLVFPALRRNLSQRAIYRLEKRLELLVRLTAWATGVVIVSGTWLLLRQTAYKTPFSSAAIHGVFALPYGRPYFLALAAKLTMYAVMVLATVPLAIEGRRQLRFGSATPPQAAPGRGRAASTAIGAQASAPGTLLAPARAPVEISNEAPSDEQHASAAVRIATIVVVFGLPVVLFCVTLLKYFHELVEASRVLPGR